MDACRKESPAARGSRAMWAGGVQDEWRGPRTLQERALLLVGDPLQTVEVPWVPTSLIQDWRLGAPSPLP